jgi:ABC-type transport system involved in multi-copper enzyme maturation permease subunit
MRWSAATQALLWLVRDTFRQALASRIFWLMLGVSALGIAVCLSVRIDGPRSLRPADEIELVGADNKPLTDANQRPYRMSLAFGAIPLGMFRGGDQEVHFLHVLLAKWIAGTVGTLLALVWTAGFLPEFLQPSAASVLMAKPAPRWSLLLGKYLGVLIFVAFQTVVFVGGTWIALGARTGIWLPGYLWSIPLLLLHFAIIFSASVMLATYTRSTVTCVFGSILFWLICFAMNYGRHAAVALPILAPGSAPYSPPFRWSVEAAYWILPKPADLVILLDGALQSREHFSTVAEFAAMQRLNGFHPWLSVLSSLLFTAGMLGIAIRQLETTDY